MLAAMTASRDQDIPNQLQRLIGFGFPDCTGARTPLIRSWRAASFDENVTEDANESGLVSKSVNTGHCPVPAMKSEKVGTHGLVSSSLFKGCCVQWFVQVPPSFEAVKVPKALPRVMKVELLLPITQPLQLLGCG